MWHRTDAVLARADVRGHMASNTTEEPKVPQVVSAYSEKKSRAMWHRADAVLARADVRGHMASNTTEEPKVPQVVSAYSGKQSHVASHKRRACTGGCART